MIVLVNLKSIYLFSRRINSREDDDMENLSFVPTSLTYAQAKRLDAKNTEIKSLCYTTKSDSSDFSLVNKGVNKNLP